MGIRTTIRGSIHRFLIDHFPKFALGREWKKQYGRSLNWKNPQTLNEKMQWLMACSDTSMWTRCSDKFLVRDYVKNKGYESILTKLYGVWDDASKIDYDLLPDKFVIKCNHDCGSTHVIDKHKGFDKDMLNADLNRRLSTPFGYSSCEPHYTKIKPLILAEEYLQLSDNMFSSSQSQVDYKFWCFNGTVHHCFICYDRQQNGHASYDMYKVDTWKECREGFPQKYLDKGFIDIPKPQNLDQMVRIAQDLSKGFPVVRVDLYNVNGKIYFGELTFTSAKGRIDYFSDSFQKEMGDMIVLPNKK